MVCPRFQINKADLYLNLMKEGYTIVFDIGDKATYINKNTGTHIFKILIRNSLYTVDNT
jgi:hypothetical protein